MFSSPFWFSCTYESSIEVPRNVYLATNVAVEEAFADSALASSLDRVRFPRY